MELIFELIFELVVSGSIEGANDHELPKGVRVGLLIFATLVYMLLTGFFVWLFWVSDEILVKVIAAGVVLFFIGMFIFMWRKVIKAKQNNE